MGTSFTEALPAVSYLRIIADEKEISPTRVFNFLNRENVITLHPEKDPPHNGSNERDTRYVSFCSGQSITYHISAHDDDMPDMGYDIEATYHDDVIQKFKAAVRHTLGPMVRKIETTEPANNNRHGIITLTLQKDPFKP